MKIVLDTNVLVSGYLWGGNEENLVKKCMRKELRNIISPEILLELEKVLSYKKFKLEKDEVEAILENILSFSTLVKPKHHFRVIEEDPNDDKFLNCADEGGAHYIVSGDKHLLRLKEFEGIKIVSSREMLSLK